MGNKISGSITGLWWISEELKASQDRMAFTIKTGDSESVIMAFNSAAYNAVLQDLSLCTFVGDCDFSNTQDDMYLCSDGDTTTSCSTPGWGVTKGDSYYLLVFGTPGTDVSGNYYFYNLAAVVVCSLIAVGLLCLVGFFCQRSKRQQTTSQQPQIVMVQAPPTQPNAVILQQGNAV